MEPLSSPDIDRQVNLLVLEHPVSVVGVQAGIADTALDHFEVQLQLVPSGQDGLRTEAGARRILADRPPNARAHVPYRGERERVGYGKSVTRRLALVGRRSCTQTKNR